MRMRLLLIIPVGLGVLCGMSALHYCLVYNEIAADKMRATVLIPEPVQTLGQVSDRKQWQTLFSVQNSGNVRLVLNELDLDCGCGNKTKRSVLVPPGKTTKIAVLLDTRFAVGSLENCVIFTTNDPTQPRVTLTVRAFVLPSPKPVHKEERNQVSVLIPQ